MKRRVVLGLFCAAMAVVSCSKKSAAPSASQRRFTDMAGRTVSIPTSVKKAFSTSPMGTTLSYTFDPELLIGWNHAINEDDAPFILEKYRGLPVLGGWFGETAGANVEWLMQSKPDIMLGVVTSPDGFTKDQSTRLAEKTGVPALILSLPRVDDTPRLYEMMGEITGNRERATTLASHARRLLERARSIALRVPPDQRIRVYYAEGLKGLNTEPHGSMHAELIDFCGGSNVATIQENNVSGYGNTPVSLEQVVAWNPDIILISDYLGKDGGLAGWRKVLADNPLWRRIKAVQGNRVYVIPRAPFQWIDRPPSVNRLAGTIWLPAIFYPDLCDYDLKSAIRDFYATFYRHHLTDEAVTGLLDTALRL